MKCKNPDFKRIICNLEIKCANIAENCVDNVAFCDREPYAAIMRESCLEACGFCRKHQILANGTNTIIHELDNENSTRQWPSKDLSARKCKDQSLR